MNGLVRKINLLKSVQNVSLLTGIGLGGRVSRIKNTCDKKNLQEARK